MERKERLKALMAAAISTSDEEDNEDDGINDEDDNKDNNDNEDDNTTTVEENQIDIPSQTGSLESVSPDSYMPKSEDNKDKKQVKDE